MASAIDHLSQQAPAVERRSIPWVPLAWFSALLIIAYFPMLRHLVEQWSTDEDVSHGFFVPPVAAFIAWQRRDRILALDYHPAWWGLAVMAWAALQGYVGTLGAELFLQRTSFLIALVGLLLVLGGTRLVRELAFPLLLLLFMIPIPAVIYNQITFPLQLFASQVAEFSLGLMGIPVLRDGNVLELASQKLSVVEACSGIRSLLSLSFLSLVYAYFFDKRVWMRWVLLAATIPIAILANSGRVTITGVLSEINPELARGFFHSLEGWIIFLIALAMLGGLHFLINRFTRKSPAEADIVKFLSSRAALAATLLIVLQGALIYSAVRPESAPSGRELSQFPTTLGSWKLLQEGVIDADTQAVLKADDLMNRFYSGNGAGANLFVAAFRSQRNGKAPHSPKNCLPGSGWTPLESSYASIDVGGTTPIQVNRYVVAHGDERSLVLYWYQSRDRAIASEYKAKFWVVVDAMRLNRTDTALVRVVVPIVNRDEAAADKSAADFVRSFYGTLRQYLPA